MKKIVVAIYLGIFSCIQADYYTDSKAKLTAFLTDIEMSLRSCQTEVKNGFTTRKYEIAQLKAKKEVVEKFIDYLKTFKLKVEMQAKNTKNAQKLFVNSVENFMQNMGKGSILGCFEEKLAQIKALEAEIYGDQRVLTNYENDPRYADMYAKGLKKIAKKQEEVGRMNSDLQETLIAATKSTPFKCTN